MPRQSRQLAYSSPHADSSPHATPTCMPLPAPLHAPQLNITTGEVNNTRDLRLISNLNSPMGVAISSDGQHLFVADLVNNASGVGGVTRVDLGDLASGGSSVSRLVTTDLANPGANFYYPTGIAISADDSVLYVAAYVGNATSGAAMTQPGIAHVRRGEGWWWYTHERRGRWGERSVR